jgi:DNA polymerase-3 subunit alpha
MKPFGLNLPTLVRLVDADCFDCLNKNRSSLRASCAAALRYAEMFSGESGQAVLFELNIPQPILVDVPNDEAENLEAEKEALGIMISGSPLSLHMDALEGKEYTPLSKAGEKNGTFKTAGAIKSIRTITAKNGKTMAFVGIYDDVGELELTVFSDQYDASYPLLKKDNVVYFSCHKDNRRENTYILEQMEAL